MSSPQWLKGLVLTSSCLLASGYLVYAGCQSTKTPSGRQAVAPANQTAKAASTGSFTLTPPTPDIPTAPPPKRFARVMISSSKVAMVYRPTDFMEPDDPVVLSPPVVRLTGPQNAMSVALPEVHTLSMHYGRQVHMPPPPPHALYLTPPPTPLFGPSIEAWPRTGFTVAINPPPLRPLALSPLPPATKPARAEARMADLDTTRSWLRVTNALRLERPLQLSPQIPVPVAKGMIWEPSPAPDPLSLEPRPDDRPAPVHELNPLETPRPWPLLTN